MDKTDNPIRARKCAELARAMGWDFIPSSSEIALPGTGEWYNPDGRLYGDEPPDPFDSADDSRALVAWLCADARLSRNVTAIYKFCVYVVSETMGADRLEASDWEECVVAAMTAPLPVIAEAAWKAIQERY